MQEGLFDSAGKVATYNIARWDGANWQALDSGLTNRATPSEIVDDPVVYDIAHTEDYIVATGHFSTAGSNVYTSPRRVELGCGIAFWDVKEQTWNSLGSGLCSPLGATTQGSLLEVHGDTVWVKGNFTHAGGKPSAEIAQFVIPPATISKPDVPEVLDFGYLAMGDTITKTLTVTNPSTSTRTMRGEITDVAQPFHISFDGTFQGSSGQTVLLPISFSPNDIGEFLDTVLISHNADVDQNIYVVLKGHSSISSVKGEEEDRSDLTVRSHPNPFSRETTITFSIQHSGPAKLAVYSLDGKEVAILIDEHRNAGKHLATWKPENLPGGTYICRLTWKGGKAQSKVLLVE